MASTRLYLVILVVAGTLLNETSALLKYLIADDAFDTDHPTAYSILNEARSHFKNADENVRFHLAPTFGHLESLHQLDESLKVMMASILEMDMNKLYTWKELRSALDTNPLMIRKASYSDMKMERISFRSTSYLGIDSSKMSRFNTIRTWFSNLIGNVDILKNTDIELDAIAEMVSKISFEIFENMLTKTIKKMTLMDLGILRFPDINRPFFSVYRISLMAKCIYKTYFVHQKETSDIVGLFQREVYYPNRDYMERINHDVIEQVVLEVEDLFND